MPPPIPVPMVTQIRSGDPRPAPKRCSAQAVALPSFSTTIGRSIRAARSSRIGSSRQTTFGAKYTFERLRSIHPAAPIPTVCTPGWRASSCLDEVDDGGRHRRGLGVRGRAAQHLEDRAVLGHDAGSHLGAADVDADREGHGLRSTAQRMSMRSEAGRRPAELPTRPATTRWPPAALPSARPRHRRGARTPRAGLPGRAAAAGTPGTAGTPSTPPRRPAAGA